MKYMLYFYCILQFYRSKNWEVTMKRKMIKHHKFTTLLFTVSLSALSLAGCGADAGQPAAETPASSVSADVQAPEPVDRKSVV